MLSLGIWLGAVALTLGIVARTIDLSLPARITSDEHHFVGNARRLLQGLPDLNDHPPLGKALIALGMQVLGDNSLGWRIVPCAVGILAMAAAFLLTRRVFGSTRAAGIALALVALDGFLVAYSRTALLDGMLAVVMLLAALALAAPGPWWTILVSALAVGLAGSIKWTGFCLLLPLLLRAGLDRRWREGLLALGVAALTYVIVSAATLSAPPGSSLGRSLWDRQIELHQSQFAPHRPHPLSSAWYTWPLLTRPMVLRSEALGDRVRVLSTMSSPLVWWGGSLAWLLSVVLLTRRGVAHLRKPESARPPDRSPDPPASLLLAVCWLAPLLPWMLTTRQSFIYHYLPSHAFALCGLAGWLDWLLVRRLRVGAVATTLLLLSAVLYLPLAAQVPVPQWFFETLLPRSWWN